MPLHPKSALSRERILSFGGPKFGKNHDFYTIVSLAQKTGSDARFYVVDTDVSMGRTLEDDRFANLLDETGNPVNIIHRNVRKLTDADSWVEINNAVDTFYGALRPQDWLFIDMLSPTWDWCQDSFTNRVWGESRDEYYVKARQSMGEKDKTLSTFEGWKDYVVINPMYNTFMTKLLTCPGNLYATAEVKAISEKADKDTQLMFGPYGVVPVGQKRVPHKFHTVIWKTQPQPGTFKATTVGDRGGRPYMEAKVIKDFAIDYLVGVAGWKVA